jgi:ABC-type antimicrobial peptide transport system permease subunit
VGVARTASIRSLGETPRPFVYQPLSQNHTTFNTLVVQTSGNAAQTAIQALAIIRDIDPDIVMFDTKTMEQHLSTVLLPAQLGAAAVSAFALLALALATLGVYGIVNYAVNRRTREVGIRMSLGAHPGAIVQMLLQRGVALIALGGLVGIAAGLLLSQVLRSFLFGVKPLDPLTFLAAPLLLVAVGVFASYIPARRASRIDPAAVLKAS